MCRGYARPLPCTRRGPMLAALWPQVHSERVLRPSTDGSSGWMTPARHDFVSPRRTVPRTDFTLDAEAAQETSLQLTYQACVIMLKCTALALFLGLLVGLLYGVTTSLVPPEKPVECERQPIHNGFILEGTEGDLARIECNQGYVLDAIVPDDLMCRRARQICYYGSPPGEGGDVRSQTWVCPVHYAYTSAELAKAGMEHEEVEYFDRVMNGTYTWTYDFCSSGGDSPGDASSAVTADVGSEQAFYAVNATVAADAGVGAVIATAAAQYDTGQGQAAGNRSGEHWRWEDAGVQAAAVSRLVEVPVPPPASGSRRAQGKPLPMLLCALALALGALLAPLAWNNAKGRLRPHVVDGSGPEYMAVSGRAPAGTADDVLEFDFGHG